MFWFGASKKINESPFGNCEYEDAECMSKTLYL